MSASFEGNCIKGRMKLHNVRRWGALTVLSSNFSQRYRGTGWRRRGAAGNKKKVRVHLRPVEVGRRKKKT